MNYANHICINNVTVYLNVLSALIYSNLLAVGNSGLFTMYCVAIISDYEELLTGFGLFTIQSRFFVMLVFLFCKLFEHYSQTNFPIIKDKAFQGNKI